ncbi:MAG: bacillithiol biosynthesis cysteine-adding enzyme BshC [candidate division Zixibacteria bacterium]
MRLVDFEKLSGSSRLFLDFINFQGSACDFFKYDFNKTESYKAAAEKIDSFSYQRDQLASILSRELADTGISEKTKNNIEKIGRPDSLVVFAGQQVGMLLGPMYTVIKAVTSYKLAAKLELELGRPVAPCFWMASDDHDFEEIKTSRFINRAGECKAESYVPESFPHGLPMADVVLDSGIEAFLTDVESELIETEFRGEIIKLIKESYRKGNGISESFTRLFNLLLGEFGIVPVDPNFPGMKKIMAPVFRNEIENHREIFKIFEDRSQAIIKAGYHRQVHKTGDNLNLFLNDNGRRNIVVENGKFRLDGKDGEYTSDELVLNLEKNPEKFSPNVCLRPVAQCMAFPTICQITGPSEAAYFAQIQPLFEYTGVPFPVIRPRIFATVMEPHIGKNYNKLSLEFSSLYNDIEGEINRVILEKYPPEIQKHADSLRPEVDKPLNDLAGFLKKNEPEGYQALERARKRIDHELNHLSKKLFAIHKKKHETVKGQIYRAAGFLFPDGKFQERVISPVYFANKFGPDIFKKIEAELDIDSNSHQIVEI